MAEPLPTAEERALYLAVLEQGGRVLLRDVAKEDAGHVLRLIELGLLFHQHHDGSLVAVNPRVVAERIGAQLRADSARLLVQAEQMPALLGELTQSYDASPPRGGPASRIQHVDRKDRIQQRVLQLQTSCREEALAAQPGVRPTGLVADNEPARAALARGAVLKILYQPESLDEETVAYATRATEWGMRLRVLDEPFTRVLVFDRRVAVVPAYADHSSAAFIEDPAVVGHLVASFERDWARAERVQWGDLHLASRLPVHEQVGRLLAEGLSQRAIAGRMGLSERTVAGHISRLRDLYDAQTLFQLGWSMRSGGRDE